ncbi:MAG TPA: S8 family serine peptidase [Kineosporiaceae bacterium]|nr:S8 family serine peptidase [Kineosporiaceae bacterium]
MSSHHAGYRVLLAALTLTATAGVALSTSSPVDLTNPAHHASSADRVSQAANSVEPASFIVQFTQAGSPPGLDRVAAVAARIDAVGGRVQTVQPALGMLVAQLPRESIEALRDFPGVLGVSPDRIARPLELDFDPAGQPGSLTNVTRSTGAQSLWRAGVTGSGVDIAVIDTGVAPVPALADPNKVVIGPDLSFDSQDPDRRYLDGFGHGTHMSSIIAGRETPRATGAEYAKDLKHFYGMAPDARLVSVKVGARDGAVDVSQLIAAIDWVVQNRHRDGLNIKILNLSFGTDSTQSWTEDPLAQAAEVAGQVGILVVVAGGNDGERARGLADPAYNPHVLAVGAVDTRGTDGYSDDRVPGFSQHSDSALGSRHPDVVAPGVGIVAPAATDAYLTTHYPDAQIGAGYLRGSGTSQAAAVVSGAAALVWQKWPDLSAFQIRELLVYSATPLAGNRAAEGNGEINLAMATRRAAFSTGHWGATQTSTQSRTGSRIATGLGTLQGARGTQSVSLDGVALTGEQDIFGRPWDSRTMASLTAGQRAWALPLGAFNGTVWIGSGFTADTESVAGRTWNGRTWAGRTWAGRTWAGQTWTGRTWADQIWSGDTWSGDSWSAASP